MSMIHKIEIQHSNSVINMSIYDSFIFCEYLYLMSCNVLSFYLWQTEFNHGMEITIDNQKCFGKYGDGVLAVTTQTTIEFWHL